MFFYIAKTLFTFKTKTRETVRNSSQRNTTHSKLLVTGAKKNFPLTGGNLEQNQAQCRWTVYTVSCLDNYSIAQGFFYYYCLILSLGTEEAVSKAEGSLGRGTHWTILEKLSTMVRIVVILSKGGSPVTKSRALWDQGWW